MPTLVFAVDEKYLGDWVDWKTQLPIWDATYHDLLAMPFCIFSRHLPNNAVSVFRLSADVDSGRVVAALASGKGKPEAVGCIKFDEDQVRGIGITVVERAGKTRDHDLNASHLDLDTLTAGQLTRLTEVLLQSDYETMFTAQVSELITQAIAAGRIRKDDLSTSMRKALGL